MNLYPTDIDIPRVELARGLLSATPDAIVIPSANAYVLSPISGAILRMIGNTISIAVEFEINSLVNCTRNTRIQKRRNGLTESPTITLNPLLIRSVPPAASRALASPRHPASLPTIFQLTLFIALGYMSLTSADEGQELDEDSNLENLANEARKPENILSLLQVDMIEMEFGYSIIPLADSSRGGDLLDRVVMIRRQCALDLGIIVPSIRLRDNIQLDANEYIIKIKGIDVAHGSVMINRYLAMNSSNSEESISGIETVDPTFGLPALWIDDKEREKAERCGYTIVDPPSVIATHLTEVIKRYSYELMGRQQIQTILDGLKENYPSLVDDIVPKIISLGDLQKVLSNLLRENVSIRDMVTILEVLGDYAETIHDTTLLTEYVRQGLKRAITKRFIPDNVARVITLDPSLEQTIAENIQQSEQGSYLSLDPQIIHKIFVSLKSLVEKVMSFGVQPIILTSPHVRAHFKKLTEQLTNDLIVLSYNELEQNVEIRSEGMVTL